MTARPIGERWITTQIGSREHYLPPVALARKGLLEASFTDFWAGAGIRWAARRWSRFRSLGTRYEAALAEQRVISFNASAVLKTAVRRKRAARNVASLYEFYRAYGEWFAKRVRDTIQGWQLDGASHRYFGFNTGCLETMRLLRERDIFCVVQQIDPARTEERLVMEERKRWPNWLLYSDWIPEAYFARLEAEWHLASRVVVNSEWSRRALMEQGVPAEKMSVIPLAYERPANCVPPVRRYAGRPLRVVWLGSVSLRKGIPYLIEAARLLERRKIEFVIAGPLAMNPSVTAQWPPNVRVLGQVYRDMVPRVIAEADVYVLPTISDGFALTQLEAMAQGLPVVTTPNCGDVVTHGEDGFIVPARDSQALAEAFARLDDDRELLARLAQNALKTIERFSIERYGDRLLAAAGQT